MHLLPFTVMLMPCLLVHLLMLHLRQFSLLCTLLMTIWQSVTGYGVIPIIMPEKRTARGTRVTA